MSSSTSSSSSSDRGESGVPDAARTGDERLFAGMLDVPLPVSVILGTGTISVRKCLALVPQSVVRLDQLAGDDVQVLVGGVLLAQAEVVLVEHTTSVRLTEIAKTTRTHNR